MLETVAENPGRKTREYNFQAEKRKMIIVKSLKVGVLVHAKGDLAVESKTLVVGEVVICTLEWLELIEWLSFYFWLLI